MFLITIVFLYMLINKPLQIYKPYTFSFPVIRLTAANNWKFELTGF